MAGTDMQETVRHQSEVSVDKNLEFDQVPEVKNIEE